MFIHKLWIIFSVVLLGALACRPVIADSLTLSQATRIASGDTRYEGYDLTVDGVTLTIDGAHSFASLTLQDGAVLTHSIETANPPQIEAGEVSIDEASRIDVSELGGAWAEGLSLHSGASYGGSGGTSPGDTTNAVYGDPRAPTDLGSGTYNHSTSPIRGGGAVKVVADRLVLDGEIRANGQSSAHYDRGGGSGGSIWLEAGVLSGTGLIKANGGHGRNYYSHSGGGGGGGRIAIYYDTLQGFDPLVRARADGGLGYRGYPPGQSGTILTEDRRGPIRVLGASQDPYATEPASQIDVRFNVVPDLTTFTRDDILVQGPSALVQPTAILTLGPIDYRLVFDPPLSDDGDYLLTLGPDLASTESRGMDQDRDGVVGEQPDDVYTLDFTIDGRAPTAPQITNLALAPKVHKLTTHWVTVQGTREADTAIWIGGTLSVPLGSGDWSYLLPLPEGESQFDIHARDAAGNTSRSVALDFFVDSVPPRLTGSTPADGSFSAEPLDSIRLDYQETGSGLDLQTSSLTVSRDGTSVIGDWSDSGVLIFIPLGGLAEGVWVVSGRLIDQLGLASSAFEVAFTIDRTPPPSPALDPLPTRTNINTLTVSGSKEAYAEVWLGSQRIVTATSATTWSHSLTLSPGDNHFELTQRDRAGNSSPASALDILFDDTAPGPIVLSVDPNGDGTQAALDWSGYDEYANGDDIEHYDVYVAASAYSDVAALVPHASVPAGTRNYIASGLTRGQAVYLAVVAVDRQGNARTSVLPLAVTPRDVVAPPEAADLQVGSFVDRLELSWTSSADPDGDLAGYRLTVNTDPAVALEASATAYSLTNLSLASGYSLRLSTIDGDANESPGLTVQAATLLPNPGGVSAEPLDGQIHLSWASVSPASLVNHYAIYVAETPFASVQGLTPVRTTTAASTRVAGLTNGRTYYLAVTTVNLSGGERSEVEPVSASPEADGAGPLISDLRLDGVLLNEGALVDHSGTLSVAVSDRTGVGRVELYVDGALIGMDGRGGDTASAYWDIRSIPDGAHTLQVRAYDTLDNLGTLERAVTVELAPPGVPTIEAPADGTVTNELSLSVSGQAEPDIQVVILQDGTPSTDPVAVDASGHFSLAVTLQEGPNRLQARASNRGGDSPPSSPVSVTLDTSVPDAPSSLSAQAREGGVVRLTWSGPSDPLVKGYRVYRAATAFSDPAAATLANATRLAGTRFDDLPPTDGDWAYRVVAVNELGTPSAPSEAASASSDRIPPRALHINYTSDGPVDAATGELGPGQVAVQLEVSEPPLVSPFLSLTVSGGIPIIVDLSPRSDTLFTGSFEVAPESAAGTAYAVFSARDAVGNRGTDIDQGATLAVDALGPRVTRLTTSPPSPVRNDPAVPAILGVAIDLSEPLAAGSLPTLTWRLSGPGRKDTPVEALTATAPTTWTGRLTLPADAGAEAVEALTFAFQGEDALGNPGSRILSPPSIQVYQGELPPLDPPTGLTAQARPDGRVALAWQPVEGAADYRLYHQAPGESELTPYQRTQGATEWLDTTVLDGEYRYAVASIRQANSQEGESAPGEAVTVSADSSAPGAPNGLSLTLIGAGIQAHWQPPQGDEPLTYRLYRAGLDPILDVSGLTPLQTDLTQPQVLDSAPSSQDHSYVVTALDAAGNESAPSPTATLNAGLLPVRILAVEQRDSLLPLLSWSPGGEATGYDLYLGAQGVEAKVNDTPLSDTTYTDVGYSGEARRYTVIVRDAAGAESLARAVTLPAVDIAPAFGAPIARGVMNRLDYRLSNRGSGALAGLVIKVRAAGHEVRSETFDLAAGESAVVPVVLGGHADLPDWLELETTLEHTPEPGLGARLIRHHSQAVVDGALAAGISAETLTRGTEGVLRFSLDNTSAAEIELIGARQGGSQPSDELRLKLLDADGNVLAVAPMQQTLGEGVVTLADGHTVIRVPAGGHFQSAPVVIPVPGGAPDSVTARLEIDWVHYHLGREDETDIPGLATQRELPLTDTAYACRITGIEPSHSWGDQPVQISGRAVEAGTDQNVASVPLTLVLSVNGYERSLDLYSDSQGQFRYAFTPGTGQSGIYSIACVHPERIDRPVQGSFTIEQLSASPTRYQIQLPRDTDQQLPLKLTAGPGSSATDLHLEYRPEYQPGGVLPEGVALTLPAPLDLARGEQRLVQIGFRGGQSTPDRGQLVLGLYTQERGDAPIARLTVDWALIEATPVLGFSPRLIDTGVAREGQVSEVLTVDNRGSAPLEELTASLVTPEGQAAPSWVYLATEPALGTLAVGETRELMIVAAAGPEVVEGYHELRLRLSAANYPTADVNVYVAVTESGVGGVLFKLSDIYTATLDDRGAPIPGLEGARVTVQNEAVTDNTHTLTSDALGEALFDELPSGRYQYRVTAPNHQEARGRFQIRPGVTQALEVFVDYTLITVQWSVIEISLEDRYEITLNATYETQVPAPVVVGEPGAFSLPEMAPGDVFRGEILLTNHGLARADDVRYRLAGNDAHFRYELLAPVPDTLEAGEQVHLPFRLVALQGLGLETQGDAGGGGCTSYSGCGGGSYAYTCANGETTESEINPTCWTHTSGSCTSADAGDGSSSGGSSSWSSVFHPPSMPSTGYSAPADPLPGAKCMPACDCAPREPCECEAPGNGEDGGSGTNEGEPSRDPLDG